MCRRRGPRGVDDVKALRATRRSLILDRAGARPDAGGDNLAAVVPAGYVLAAERSVVRVELDPRDVCPREFGGELRHRQTDVRAQIPYVSHLLSVDSRRLLLV